MQSTPTNTPEEWDALWRLRHQADALEALESTLGVALAARREYSALWRAARLAHFRAMQSEEEGQTAAALTHFEEGKSYAQNALDLNHHDVEGQFWMGVNLLEWARRKGWLQAASNLRSAEAHIERAVNQDEEYHFAGPVRVAARIMHLKPLLLGGSLDRAIDMYRRALQIAPHNSTTLLYYAEALIADQQKKLARQALQQIVDAPDDVDWIWEQARDRRLARTLLEKMDASL